MIYYHAYAPSQGEGLRTQKYSMKEKRHTSFDIKKDFVSAVLNFMLSHGVLLLGSVIHHAPTKRPHNWLFFYLKTMMFIYTVNNVTSVWHTIYYE